MPKTPPGLENRVTKLESDYPHLLNRLMDHDDQFKEVVKLRERVAQLETAEAVRVRAESYFWPKVAALAAVIAIAVELILHFG